MSEPTPRQHLLAVIDASAFGRAALETAAALAAELQAELHSLFQENIDLRRLAALPFAREVSRLSARLRPLEPAAVERMLQAEAEGMRRAVEAACRPLQVPWTFDIAADCFVRAVQQWAPEQGLLLAGCRRREYPLPAAPAFHGAQPVAVVGDASPAGRRAVERARQAASGLRAPLWVLLEPEWAASDVEAPPRAVAVRLPSGGVDALAAAAARGGVRLLVVAAGEPWLPGRAEFETLLERLPCPLLLVS